MKTLCFAMLLAVFSTGCQSVSEGLIGSLDKIKDDNATWVVPTPYGRAVRANPRSDQTVEVTADSVKVIGHVTNAAPHKATPEGGITVTK